MTLDELRDWHAKRAGWTHEGGCKWFNANKSGIDATIYNHPFPATLDGADASFPKGWRWKRGMYFWTVDGIERRNQHLSLSTPDTGDKIRDLYELSKLAWEQEAA